MDVSWCPAMDGHSSPSALLIPFPVRITLVKDVLSSLHFPHQLSSCAGTEIFALKSLLTLSLVLFILFQVLSPSSPQTQSVCFCTKACCTVFDLRKDLSYVCDQEEHVKSFVHFYMVHFIVNIC